MKPIRFMPDEVRDADEIRQAMLFAAEFRENWGHVVIGIIASGHVLIRAKAKLSHGMWLWFVENELPLGARSVQRLMAIAKSPNFAEISRNVTDKRPTESYLPPSWRTLYELAVLPPDTYAALRKRGAIHAEMTRGDVKAALAALDRPDRTAALGVQAVAAPGTYGAILADPPWRFETRGRGGDRLAETHYPTMSLEAICALPVGDLAARDCALFLWITTEQLMRAREVMEAWGFAYKTVAFVWRKTSGPMGLGYWTRKQTELCLLGVRGQPRRVGADVEDIIEAPRGAHSAKPDEQYARIERLVPGPYLELFARRPRAGWDAWGNEVAAE